MLRRAFKILLLALPLPLLTLVASHFADVAGHAVGVRVAAALALPLPPGEVRQVGESKNAALPHFDAVTLTQSGRARSLSAATRKPGRAPRNSAAASAPRGLRVSAEAVLRLANAGVRPSAKPVAAYRSRPAGLWLTGVSSLGIGLRDGDVLTHAGGQPVRSVGDVIAIVIASRGARLPAISGRFWRNGETWQLVVEQPYVLRHGNEGRGDSPRTEIAVKRGT